MAALVARWAALAPRIRVLLGALALAALGAAVFAVALQRDSRVPLFAAPLSSDALAEVAERLSEWNVPFVPTQTNVRVDPQRRGDLLLRLSLAGVPHGHLASTAEALAKAGPLTPQMVLEAQQRDGLAGDVASGLRGLPGVADARVIIAPPNAGRSPTIRRTARRRRSGSRSRLARRCRRRPSTASGTTSRAPSPGSRPST